MPRVIECLVCGADSVSGLCTEHEREQRRARRHPGYDDPTYRRERRRRCGPDKACERCRRRPARILHHIDGDPGHNVPSNYLAACGPCASELDDLMRARRAAVELGPRPPIGGARSPWR